MQKQLGILVDCMPERVVTRLGRNKTLNLYCSNRSKALPSDVIRIGMNEPCKCKEHLLGDLIVNFVSVEALLNMCIWVHVDSSEEAERYQPYLNTICNML